MRKILSLLTIAVCSMVTTVHATQQPPPDVGKCIVADNHQYTLTTLAVPAIAFVPQVATVDHVLQLRTCVAENLVSGVALSAPNYQRQKRPSRYLAKNGKHTANNLNQLPPLINEPIPIDNH